MVPVFATRGGGGGCLADAETRGIMLLGQRRSWQRLFLLRFFLHFLLLTSCYPSPPPLSGLTPYHEVLLGNDERVRRK